MVNRIDPYYWLVFAAAIAACSNAAPGNSSGANSGSNGATGGENAGGSTAAFSGAQNNTGGGSSQAGMSSSGGSSAAIVGGTSANGGTSQGTGGSLGCGDTLTLGSVSPSQLSGELAQSHKFLLINVHVPVSGHIPGTDVDIDYRDVAAIESYIGADKSKPAVIYCMSDLVLGTAKWVTIAVPTRDSRQLT